MSGAGTQAERAAIVREVVDALNAGDWDRALAHTAADFEYDLTRTISPLRGVYARDEMRDVVEEFLGPWESARYEIGELVHLGDRVVVPYSTQFRGRDGIEVSTEATWVFAFRGDEVVRLTLYQDRDDAIAEATA